VKVLSSLCLILVFNTLCKRLILSVLIGTAVLAVWCGYSIEEGLQIVHHRILSLDIILLTVVILQVTWLSSQMDEAGIMKDLVESIRRRVGDRASIATLPAVIGFLPMPGGALFSAPLVESCDKVNNLPPMLKVRINYWFRHIWECWWPLYPGVLLALEISGIEPWRFVIIQFPFSIVAVCAGYFFFLRKMPPSSESKHSSNQTTQCNDRMSKEVQMKSASIISLVAPIIIIAAIYAAISLITPEVAAINKYVPLVIGIFCAAVFVQFQRRLLLKQWIGIIFSTKTLTMALLVVAIHLYGAFIESKLPDGTLLVSSMRMELAQWGIPPYLMMMILPFVAAFTTGLTLGFIGASLPIAMSLIGEDPAMGVLLGGVSLTYVCGFAGLILSPVHICLIVTNEHFKTKLSHSLAGLVLPSSMLIASAVALSALYKWIW